MNKIQQLIQQYCPNGVEFKELGEIGKVCMCKRVMKHETKSAGDIPFYKIGTFGKEADAYISKELFEKYINKFSFPTKGDILISASGTIGRRVIYDAKPAYFQDSNIVWLSNNETIIMNKYLYYVYETIEWPVEGGTIKRLYNDNFKKIIIPIPPLPIQQEIVTNLDTFTALDGSLQAELEARRKQYEHYRNQLLNFEGKEVEWKTLGEIGEFVRGTGLQKTDFVEKGVGCIHYGQIYTYYDTFIYKTKSFVSEDLAIKLKKVNKGDLIITTTSENLEDVCTTIAWLGDEEIVTGAHASIFRHNQNAKYLAYYFQTDDIFNQKKRYAKGTKVIEIKANEIGKFKIPIPPLSEQERIVEILDKFEALVSVELPAEIAARRKQYEYYREKLLDFKTLQT